MDQDGGSSSSSKGHGMVGESFNQQEKLRGKVFLPAAFIPGVWDVICQRGRASYDHVGNKHFRGVVDKNIARYVKAKSKLQKSQIVTDIVNTIRNNAGTGGFVKKDLLSGEWYEVGDKLARDKVGQALRDGIKAVYPDQPTTSNYPEKLQKPQSESIMPEKEYTRHAKSRKLAPSSSTSFWESENRATLPHLPGSFPFKPEMRMGDSEKSHRPLAPPLCPPNEITLQGASESMIDSFLPGDLLTTTPLRVPPSAVASVSNVGHNLLALAPVGDVTPRSYQSASSIPPPAESISKSVMRLNESLALDLQSFLTSQKDDDDQLSMGGEHPWTESDLTPNHVTYPFDDKKQKPQD